MIRVDGHTFWRGGEKVGFIEDNHIKNYDGDRVGYYIDEHIYNSRDHKVAYLLDDYICFTDSSKKIRIEDNNKDVYGGSLNNVQRAAVRVLLGE
ncbi:MAG TPA: hypothetical protein VF817_03955 [Patescibacteria group bacterium]